MPFNTIKTIQDEQPSVEQEKEKLCRDDPDYRYHRVRYLRALGREGDPSEDPWCTEFLDYYNFVDEGQANEQEVEELYPHISQALTYRSEERKLRNVLIECTILCDAPSDEVAAFMDVDEKTVLAYEKLFYDLRDLVRERCGGALMSIALRPVLLYLQSHDSSFVRADPEDVLRYASYHMRWKDLRTIISGYEMVEAYRNILRCLVQKAQALKVPTATMNEMIHPGNASEMLERVSQNSTPGSWVALVRPEDKDSETSEIMDQLAEVTQNMNFERVDTAEQIDKDDVPELERCTLQGEVDENNG